MQRKKSVILKHYFFACKISRKKSPVCYNFGALTNHQIDSSSNTTTLRKCTTGKTNSIEKKSHSRPEVCDFLCILKVKYNNNNLRRVFFRQQKKYNLQQLCLCPVKTLSTSCQTKNLAFLLPSMT